MTVDGRKDRLWIVGGCVVALLLAVAGYFLLIGPQRGTTAERDTQAADARAEIPVLKKKLADLKADNQKLDEYKAQLDKDKAALPDTAGIPEYLRLMQTLGTQAGVGVDTVTLGTPTLVTTPAGVHQIPVTLLLSGSSAARIDGFMAALQQVQPRAILVTNIDVVPVEADTSLNAGVTATVTAQIFVTGGGAAPAGEPTAADGGNATKGTD